MHTIWIKYSVWIVSMFWKLYGCVGRYQSLVTHTHQYIHLLYCIKNVRNVFVRSLFLSLFFHQYKGKEKEREINVKNNKTKIGSSHLIDIWLWERLQFNKKNHIVLFSLSLSILFFVLKAATQYTSYIIYLLCFSIRSVHKTAYFYDIYCHQTKWMFYGQTVCCPNPSVCLPHGIERRNEEKWIVDIDAAYLLLHNQKFIHLHRLVWSGTVRFSWMVKNVSQSGRDKKKKKHHKMWNNWKRSTESILFFSLSTALVCVRLCVCMRVVYEWYALFAYNNNNTLSLHSTFLFFSLSHRTRCHLKRS